MLNKILFWLTSIVVLFSFSVSSNAADVKWDMANEYQESSIHGEGQKVFSSVLADKSGGSIVITMTNNVDVAGVQFDLVDNPEAFTVTGVSSETALELFEFNLLTSLQYDKTNSYNLSLSLWYVDK